MPNPPMPPAPGGARPMPNPRLGPGAPAMPPSAAPEGRAMEGQKPPGGGGMRSKDEVEAEIEGSIPEPTDGGYDIKLLNDLAEAGNKALHAILGDNAPEGDPIVVGEYAGGKLPLSLIGPIAILSDLCVSLGEASGKRYEVDLGVLKDDKALKVLLAQLDLMATDKKLKKAIDAKMESEGEEAEEAEEAEEKEMEPVGLPKPPKGVRAGL